MNSILVIQLFLFLLFSGICFLVLKRLSLMLNVNMNLNRSSNRSTTLRQIFLDK
jgi:hypothetical protein